MKQTVQNLACSMAVLFLLVLIAVACTGIREGSSRNRGTEPEISEDHSNNESIEAEDSGNKDAGDFVVELSEVQNPKYVELDQSFKKNKVLEKAADKLNRALILPHDISLRTKDCNEANAFYNPRERSITFCYELMEHFYRLFKIDGDSDEEAYERVDKTLNFVFLHEVGHALIDSYELPITGNEEDAADRLSSFICIEELGDEGVESIEAAAEAFAIESRIRGPNKRNMADEHLLQEQRVYNSLCMIYGSNPNKYSYYRINNLLPAARADRCPADYERTSRSWEDLLRPWRKE